MQKKAISTAKKNPPAIPDGVTPDPDVDSDSGIDSIRISENVIASVTRKYVLQVDGVVRFASGSIVSGLAEMIGRKSQESSIVVNLDGDAVHIGVNLVLRFGVQVPKVAGQVQDVIRKQVEELTGKHVTGVRVTVQDLQEVEDKPEPEAAAEAGGK